MESQMTMMQPKTRYARSGDVHIAYQVLGEGPFDVVLVPGFVSHLELAWEAPPLARFYRRLASFSRLILFDKRGVGLSDRVSQFDLPSLEQRVDDVRAVMDAVGSERAALLGYSEGGAMSVLLAATYPDRVSALVLCSSFAKWDMMHSGWHRFAATFDEAANWMEHHWGEGIDLEIWAPSLSGDERHREAWGRVMRHAASPGTAQALLRMVAQTDVTDILPVVRVPTLVLHRGDEVCVEIASGRYLAERIPGAKFAELEGVDHLPWIGDQDAFLDEIQEFLTGVRPVPESDRVLATVLFTDIVGSTELASRLGDRAWQDLLDRHHALVRHELARFRGREVDTAGDGFFAIFDGPGRAIHCACNIRDGVRQFGIEIRAGLHTGEVELTGDKIGGIAVHIAARVAATAQAGEVLASSTIKDLVAGSRIRFSERGTHILKGVPGEWRLFAAE
jgi:class 3 adenylate cyclase